MKIKPILCVILLIVAIGLSGCVQNTPVDDSHPSGTIGFYNSFPSSTLGFYPVESSDPKYQILSAQPVGWYAYELSQPPMKVIGYSDSTLGIGAREVNVYYVGLSTNNQK
ncbi:MAG: hypothetical protein PHW62_01535 [Candidatus Ratteibacteria bacterium]|nr:hypothetical protein [Candidatus Ratteibacteria bacterium]